MTTTEKELDSLRLSVARLAQHLGISAKEIPAHSFFGAPNTSERGWNRLIAICMNYLEDEYGINHGG